MTLRALDMFCGAGGATKGLQRAGFHVTGIDNRPQPRYCGDLFVQADALRPPFNLRQFDFIWASPPCQDSSVGSRRWKAIGYTYPPAIFISIIRDALVDSGVPWCIENVPGAPLRADIILTGPMFGLKTQRRRHFELSFYALAPDRPWRNGPKTTPGFVTVAGNGGDGPNRIGAFKEALGVEWMTKPELREAIPPAYSEFIGRAAIASATHLQAAE